MSERDKVKPGEPIRAKAWNRLIDMISGGVAGDRRVSISGIGTAARRGVGGGDVFQPVLHIVRVILDPDTAGLHGDAENPCGYLYDVYPRTGEISTETQIATGLSPRDRALLGWYDFLAEPDSVPEYSFGLAFQDPNTEENEWKLAEVDGEVPHTLGCNCTCL